MSASVHSKNKHQLATLCYVRDSQNTLMICKDKDPKSVHYRKYNGLGGKIESGETPRDSVIREVFEESGLSIESPELLGLLIFPDFTPPFDWYVFVYVAKNYSGVLVESNEGSLSWVHDDDLLKLNLWQGDKEFLPYVISEEKFTGRFDYKDSELVSFEMKPGLDL